MNFDLEFFTALCIGITLSAASGFRVFLPALILSIGANQGNLLLTPQLDWIGTYPTLLVLAIATFIEICSYYIPIVDNFLSTLAVPAAFAIGTILTAALLPDLAPVVRWTLSLVLGGGTASSIEVFTSLLRLVSTGVTAGIGNPLLSTIEILISITLSLLGLFVPLLAIVLVFFLLYLTVKRIRRYLRSRKKSI